jgi:nucleoid-associated protein YgaU
MASNSFSLPASTRYKDTAAYATTEGAKFALWEPPPEFTEPSEDARLHSVRKHEVGFLDLLARRYYGDGYESMWWAIALANAIIDPEIDMKPGDVLVIPPRSAVLSYLARTRDV